MHLAWSGTFVPFALINSQTPFSDNIACLCTVISVYVSTRTRISVQDATENNKQKVERMNKKICIIFFQRKKEHLIKILEKKYNLWKLISYRTKNNLFLNQYQIQEERSLHDRFAIMTTCQRNTLASMIYPRLPDQFTQQFRKLQSYLCTYHVYPRYLSRLLLWTFCEINSWKSIDRFDPRSIVRDRGARSTGVLDQREMEPTV